MTTLTTSARPGARSGLAPAATEAEVADGVHTISQVTRDFGVTARALRFYEAEGLLRPVRRGQQRLYPPRVRTRLKLILRGKRLGFSLAEIKDILAMYAAAPGEAGQLRHLIDRIGARREQLEQKRRDIEATLADLDAVEAGCRERLGQLGAGADPERAP